MFGWKARGNESDGHFNHETGVGWVLGQLGDYNDAIINKGNSVELALVEASGAIHPRLHSELKKRSALAMARGGVDRTKYKGGAVRQHMHYHATAISSGAVLAHAKNINDVARAKTALAAFA